MTLSIPYSFIPGTKAKAEEVNANFNYLVENVAGKDFSDLTSDAEKHFLNKTRITNCILEAPNGVVSKEGPKIIIKSGLKLLIPNGRNADGSLNNIEYKLASDVIYDRVAAGYGTVSGSCILFIELDSGIILNAPTSVNIYIGKDSDKNSISLIESGSRFYYAEDTNFWYKRTTVTGPNWERASAVPILNFKYDGNNTNYTEFNSYEPIRLIEARELDGKWVNSFFNMIASTTAIAANSNRTFDLSSYLPADENTYEILVSGSFSTPAYVGQGFDIRLATGISSNISFALAVSRTNDALYLSNSCVIPVGKDRKITLTNLATNNGCNVQFLRASAYRKVR